MAMKMIDGADAAIASTGGDSVVDGGMGREEERIGRGGEKSTTSKSMND